MDFKKHILILVNYDYTIYNFRKELVEKLLKEGSKITISSPKGQLIDKLTAIGCKHIETNIERHGTNPLRDLEILRHYYKILKEIKPDLVLTYTIKPNIYGGMACRRLKIPYISTITGLGKSLEKSGFMRSIIRYLYKKALKEAKCVFFQNQEDKKYFIKGIYNGRFEVVPGSGVNIEKFRYLSYPDDDVVRFLYISRIMREKGILEYLRAAEIIRGIYSRTEFDILGFYEDNLRNIVDVMVKKGFVTYWGWKNDVRIFYERAHCVILPTKYKEGMSNVLLESAASGRPVIATDIAGCREIVDNGVSGFLIGNEGELIEKIEKFLAMDNEKRRTMGLAGRLKVEREFNRNMVVDTYLKEIFSVFSV